MMGPGMMGPGYGMGGPGGGGYGMRGPGYGYGPGRPGWRGGYQAPQGLTGKELQAWQQSRAKFMADTLKLRQELAAKRIELQSLWSQPKPDQARVRQLSNEVAEMQAKLAKQRDQYLQQCREQFGDKGWACPGGGWGGQR